MPARRRTGQSTNFIIGHYRKLVKDPAATVAQKMKILDRLAVIDKLLDIKLIEPDDTKQPTPSPKLEATDAAVQRMLDQVFERKKKSRGANGDQLPESREGNS